MVTLEMSNFAHCVVASFQLNDWLLDVFRSCAAWGKVRATSQMQSSSELMRQLIGTKHRVLLRMALPVVLGNSKCVQVEHGNLTRVGGGGSFCKEK